MWLSLLPVWGQEEPVWKPEYRFRIQLSDKQQSPYALERPEEFLSSRALQRRERQGLPLDETDLPVSPVYLDQLRQAGLRIHCVSKWNNTVLAETADSLLGVSLSRHFAFVRSVRCVWVEPVKRPKGQADRKEQVKNEGEAQEALYGNAWQQCAQMKGDSLHRAGFRGRGMVVAVIDAGFYNADAISAFEGLNLLGTRDFVNPHSDIYAENSHGMKVLSCLAANRPHYMVGTAPEASYWLLRSEDHNSEQPVEMDYWAAAVEFADSVGADVVNTSLGYASFDNRADNLHYWELDGESTLISRSASMAARKGMLVVCSAGNSGDGTWKKITPPGDACDVLTVGAVDRRGLNTSFSSVGNTADGRVKPDVCAMGGNCTVMGNDGAPTTGSGTSYASPILCGLVTCLWQALPQLTALEVMELVRRHGHNAAHPDNIFGYGIPDFWEAYREGSSR